MLSKRNFVIYGPRGEVLTLYCKVCGTKIASTIPRPGPFPGSVPVLKFTRSNMYAEIKMECDDGSFHVTNGCKNCLSMQLRPSMLREMYKADMADLGVFTDVIPIRVVTVDRSAGGII